MALIETKEVSREEYEQLDAANRGDIMYFELMLSNWETVPIPIQVAFRLAPSAAICQTANYLPSRERT